MYNDFPLTNDGVTLLRIGIQEPKLFRSVAATAGPLAYSVLFHSNCC